MMNNILSVLVSELIPAKSKGYSFMLYETMWRLDKNNNISVGMIHDLLDPETLSGFLHTLSFYARNLSAAYTRHIFRCFLDMIRATKATRIDDIMLIGYRSSLDAAHEHELSCVSILLRKWYRLGYPGVSKNVVCLLEGWRLKGGVRGMRLSDWIL